MITILYDGRYPNLCSGKLIVDVDGITWTFPPHCMESGGSVSFDADCSERITHGEWRIRTWPEGFPNELKEAVLDKVNETIPCGCCGGCV